MIERIRADSVSPGATIMMLTSADQTSSAARCRRMGVESYLIKPIKPAELLATIRRALGRLHSEAVPRRPAAAHAAAGRSLRILVAEDNLVNQKYAFALLEKMGHRVTLASNGAEAIDKWSEGQFDLIFMDVQMPEMDGFEATRSIRRQEMTDRTHIPIVAMTAHAMNGDRERCLAAGMDYYVSKPVSRKAVEQAIAQCAYGETTSTQ